MEEADLFKIKMILGLFTVEKGKIKVYLIKKQGEPYKGHWALPSKPHAHADTFAVTIHSLLEKPFGLEEVYTEDFQTFEDKEVYLKDKIVHVSAIAIVDALRAKNAQNSDEESEWFDVMQLPKLAYNHAEIIEAMVSYLQTRLKDKDMIQILFPSEFTLPELQSFCEQLEEKKYDRRNFRKKVLALNILQDTGKITNEVAGRPAKLYTFQKNIEEMNLF